MDLNPQQGTAQRAGDGGALRLAHQALAACVNAVAIVDAASGDFAIHYANPAMGRLCGLPQDELLGRPARLLAPGEGERALLAALRGAAQQQSEQRVQLCRTGQDGAPSCVDLCVLPEAGHLICVFNDQSELRAQQARLAQLASHDALTGLPNRLAFNGRLQEAMIEAGRRGDGLAVLCLAVDSHNLVSESLGHVAGDQLLVACALRLAPLLRAHETLARHGGNQFVLVLAEISSPQQAGARCAQLLGALAPPLALAGQHHHPSCSIGIARYPNDGDDVLTLLRYAELARADARHEGGNRHQFYAAEMGQRSAERIQMEAGLRFALEHGQLQLQYQPLADLRDGTVCALEALVRWQHPRQGLLSAASFMPLAEQAGMTASIGHWILARACRDIKTWHAAGLEVPRVAINISPRQLRDPSLPQRIVDALQEAGIGPEQLVLEITEAALTADPAASDHALALLQDVGVGLALDDFGTGYASLNHLKRFPLDLVKIDGALIRNAGAGDLVATIIAMAHQLGIEVSAEGVETEAQCDFLRRNMCDLVQGYFFHPPVDADACAALLRARLALAPQLLRIQQQKRCLLLVDDEHNIVSSLRRLLRRDDYQILTAASGQEGLEQLARHKVDVIVSDQRMPGMLGVDFLRAAKQLYPDTIRIMLSGYTELQSVTDAVNEGAIYKFLTKPWDDERLRSHIADAFRLREIADENLRLNLELRTANHELAAANRRMEDVLRQKQQQITHGEVSLGVAREVLERMPLAVLGVDDDGMLAFLNAAAGKLLAGGGALLGNQASLVLPELFADPACNGQAEIKGRRYQLVRHAMGAQSQSRGSLITLSPCEWPA
ncbi:MAG: EAL domain-containing protein [Pseudomonadota bacterium]